MGIDVYLRWDQQTDAEKEAQYTGFSIVSGHVGYLREAYHGEPYATAVLMPEGSAEIPAAVLRERLPAVLEAVRVRHTTVYHDSDEAIATYQKAYTDFVELAEQKERETGQPIKVIVS